MNSLKKFYKSITLNAIKFGPSVLALLCSVKILLSSFSGATSGCMMSIHWINLILNSAATGVLYCAGQYFGYCWKHASVCRISMWGYIYYAVFMIFDIPLPELRLIMSWYVLFVVIITIWYSAS